MQLRNRILTARGLLCSIAIIAVYCISAIAMQPQPGQSLLPSMEGAQQPKEEPNSQQDVQTPHALQPD